MGRSPIGGDRCGLFPRLSAVAQIPGVFLANSTPRRASRRQDQSAFFAKIRSLGYRRTTSASTISTRSTGVSPSVGTASIRSTTSKPSTTTPNTV